MTKTYEKTEDNKLRVTEPVSVELDVREIRERLASLREQKRSLNDVLDAQIADAVTRLAEAKNLGIQE